MQSVARKRIRFPSDKIIPHSIKLIFTLFPFFLFLFFYFLFFVSCFIIQSFNYRVIFCQCTDLTVIIFFIYREWKTDNLSTQIGPSDDFIQVSTTHLTSFAILVSEWWSKSVIIELLKLLTK